MWIVGCWLTTKPAVDPSAEEWRREGRVIVMRPGEDACVAVVGQSVDFPFQYKSVPSEIIATIGVRVNGKRVKKPQVRHMGQPSDPAVVGYADVVYTFRAEKPGVYHLEVTPYYLENGRGTPWECVVIVKGADS
jgi:hypothetical protein